MTGDTLALTSCPECGQVAEIVREDLVPTTDGVLRHLFLRCLYRHWFLMPVEIDHPQPAARRSDRTSGCPQR